MGFIIIVFIIIPLVLLIKKGSPAVKQYKNLIVYIIKVLVIYIIISLPLSLFKLSPEAGMTITKIYLIGAVIFFVGRILTYKNRANRYVSEYIVGVVADNSKTNQLTEASFFRQPKTQSLLSERVKVGKQTNYEFLQQCLRENIYDSLKYAFQRELFSNDQIITDRVFFYYEFYDYDLYCNEQNIDLVDVLSSFNIIQTLFTYVPGSVFFSNDLLERMQADFIPFISKEPKLSDVPFSSKYLENTMYSNGTLSPYISQDALAALDSNRNLFEEDFIELYHGVANEDINRYVAEGKLNVLPNQNDDKKQIYSLKHEDENGIIQEEYGQSAEQHRVTLDIDLPSDQLDDLDGCPA